MRNLLVRRCVVIALFAFAYTSGASAEPVTAADNGDSLVEPRSRSLKLFRAAVFGTNAVSELGQSHSTLPFFASWNPEFFLSRRYGRGCDVGGGILRGDVSTRASDVFTPTNYPALFLRWTQILRTSQTASLELSLGIQIFHLPNGQESYDSNGTLPSKPGGASVALRFFDRFEPSMGRYIDRWGIGVFYQDVHSALAIKGFDFSLGFKI